MEENPDPNRKPRDPIVAVLWLFLGLAPIPILLLLAARPQRPELGYVLVFCVLCNLLGGFGCAGGVRDMGARIGLGIVLAIAFFFLTCVVALFAACSHMNI